MEGDRSDRRHTDLPHTDVAGPAVVPAHPAPTDVEQAEEALERLFRLTAGRSLYRRQSEAVGVEVTRAGYGVLRTLDEAGPLGTTELAKRCAMDPGATVRQVKAMEGDGLVSRTTGTDDARVTVVALTDAGCDVYRRIVEVRTAHLAQVLADWTDADRATLARLVDRLVEGLSTVPFRPTPKESP